MRGLVIWAPVGLLLWAVLIGAGWGLWLGACLLWGAR